MVGLYVETSQAEHTTLELWRRFMPGLKEVPNRTNQNLYSIQQYDTDLNGVLFTPHTRFITWAAVEVNDFEHIPVNMKEFVLSGGRYAVFMHKGSANAFSRTAQYIFEEWLPASNYELDIRPHFQIMGEKYQGPDHPDSVEEVWVPVRQKSEA
jgi:AraC family transcriptional regulator